LLTVLAGLAVAGLLAVLSGLLAILYTALAVCT